MPSLNSFGTETTLEAAGRTYTYYRLDRLGADVRLETLPCSIRILLENLLRNEDGLNVTSEHIHALANYDAKNVKEQEIPFSPARVLLQDFTGVPCLVDLASMRDGIVAMGGEAQRINPLVPVDLVIDHSVQVDSFGLLRSFQDNVAREFERNGERYRFLKWGQKAFQNFRVVPPGMGIVHQVNIEYLASVVFTRAEAGRTLAYPDTLVGTDSHTTMVNGIGVVGWGVGGIEAEAAMLGQPQSMLIPEVIGFELVGSLRPGVTATDLVLTITQMLRKKGVVGKFVEFFGAGLDALPAADRTTIGNMAPEYGATVGYFPVDAETLTYLRLTGRSEEQIALVEAYARAQGLFRSSDTPAPVFTDALRLHLADVEPSLAGPKRPQDRVALTAMKPTWRKALLGFVTPNLAPDAASDWVLGTPAASVQDEEARKTLEKRLPVDLTGAYLGPTLGRDQVFTVGHGDVVIAAITSCTNTSNPSVMLAAGLLARKAREKGLSVKPWVKTSLAPGSQVVTEYLQKAGVLEDLEALRFFLVGYGCTTCIGNSGPLEEPISRAIQSGNLTVCSVLSGNRNFEGRISPDVKANYLASPPLVVAYALAGTVDIDFEHEPLGVSPSGEPVFLKDVWPSPDDIKRAIDASVSSDLFVENYASVFLGGPDWQNAKAPDGARFAWEESSTYIAKAPYFKDISIVVPEAPGDIVGMRCLLSLGDSITTDHISPAGNIKVDSPAGEYLLAHGVAARDFNQYGTRRGHHDVMVRGTFANIRLKNWLAAGKEGGYTRFFGAESADGPIATVFDAAQSYRQENVPLLVLAGKEYGAGSSRDWAAKGTLLLGVRVVIAESYERIHRSNLVGMGVLPLQFLPGESRETLGLTGTEVFDLVGLERGLTPGATLQVVARSAETKKVFSARSRIDTKTEVNYFRHGGILQYVLRQLARG
jgi:aconitate hydratase